MPNSQSTSSPASSEQTPSLDQNTVRADADAITEEVGAVAGKIKDEAVGQATHLLDEAKAQAANAATKVKGLAGEQKEFIAGQLDGVADAVQRVATDLEGENASSAHYARMIADNAEKLSSLVRDNDVDQLLAIAQDFGRRQPVAFLGAAALLGFAASRFVTASAQRQQDAERQRLAEDGMAYQPATAGKPDGGASYDQGRV